MKWTAGESVVKMKMVNMANMVDKHGEHGKHGEHSEHDQQLDVLEGGSTCSRL